MINKWKDVSIEMFFRMNSIPKDDDYTFNLIAILTGKTLDEVLSQPLSITQEEAAQLSFINKAPSSGMMKLKYKIGEKTYRAQIDMEHITTAQYVDFQTLGDKEMKSAESVSSLLACVLIPEGCKYNDGYSKDEASKEIAKYLSIEDAMTVCRFFIKWSEILGERIMRLLRSSLRKAMKKAPTREMKEQLKQASEGLSSLGWEQLMLYLNSQGSVGKEYTNTPS